MSKREHFPLPTNTWHSLTSAKRLAWQQVFSQVAQRSAVAMLTPDMMKSSLPHVCPIVDGQYIYRRVHVPPHWHAHFVCHTTSALSDLSQTRSFQGTLSICSARRIWNSEFTTEFGMSLKNRRATSRVQLGVLLSTGFRRRETETDQQEVNSLSFKLFHREHSDIIAVVNQSERHDRLSLSIFNVFHRFSSKAQIHYRAWHFITGL